MGTLRSLLSCGQSYWLDNLTRATIRTGELERRVMKEGLRGVTFNPAIFQKALAGTEYDLQLRDLTARGATVPEIYDALVLDDTRRACDILRPVFDASDGEDGFVSLEVSPHLAYNREGTQTEARRLWRLVDRPNLLVKIPGTRESVPAVEDLLYEGININITLLFSLAQYEEVTEAYLGALERRLSEGNSIRGIASVATFLVSRVDVLVDQLLGEKWISTRTVQQRARHAGLFGKAGIANAKLAYQFFLQMRSSDRWKRLNSQGARVQRLVWACTAAKDPVYRDVRYVECLVGKDTVITLPEETAAGFLDHGRINPDSVQTEIEESRRVFEGLAAIGIDFTHVAELLLDEAVRKFVQPHDRLLASLVRKRQSVVGKKLNRQLLPGTALKSVRNAVGALDTRRFLTRLNEKDGTLWSADPETARFIENRLGWLDAVSEFQPRTPDIMRFAQAAREDAFRQVVLLGMGGSSLSAKVCLQTFGSARGWPDFLVLDNTDPAAVSSVASLVQSGRTLFVISSKSGTTLETISFYRYFYDLVASRFEAPGSCFVAITDPGTWLAKEAVAKKFRKSFLNPPNIGGRYSALSYFGLVPMALLGLDVSLLLQRAGKLQAGNGPGLPAESSPAVELGALLGYWARTGRNKLTLVSSDSVGAIGPWIEHLLGGSTGKEGRGIVPIVGERLGSPAVYGRDRFFVSIAHPGTSDKLNEKRLGTLEKNGFPVVRLTLPDRMGLAEEFVRWEVAAAAAAVIMRINPFDEPDLLETREMARELLAEWRRSGVFPGEQAAVESESIALYDLMKRRRTAPEKLVADFTGSLQPGDYFALLPYFRRTGPRERLLGQLRAAVRDRFKVATTLGYGPRYLHSTGQLHKGGPNQGIFLVFTAESESEVPIPGQPFGFQALQRAQALADIRALQARGRRVLRVHLKGELKSGLKKILDALK
jgi:transaldolase / glucose-6-phosphate isomerase